MTRKTQAKLWVWLVVPVLGLLEIAWLSWFLVEPLPNAQNIGGTVRRWVLLSRALPHVIPGVTYGQSYLGLAMRELGHVENLPQRLPIVLSAAWIAVGAMSLGELALRSLRLRKALTRLERIPLAFGLGTAGLGVLALLAGRLGLLALARPWGTRAGLGILLAAELLCRFASRSTAKRPSMPSPVRWPAWVSLALIAAPFLVPMLLAAMLPTIDFDARVYHLQGPKEYFETGRIRFLPHNAYTNMPFNVEMLHLLGMEVIGDWWRGALAGQVVVMFFAPAAAAMIALVATRWASPRAGWFAAVIYLTTPWVYRLGALPYVEGPLCFFHAALLWAVGRAWDALPRQRPSFWGVAGGLAGGAMACKYPALISAVLPFGAVALLEATRRRSWPVLLAFAAGCATIITPWLGKNVIDTGNPVFPLAYNVFGARFWNTELDAKWRTGHGSALIGERDLTASALLDSVLDVAGRSDWQSPLFTALAPLALLRPGSRRVAVVLWGFALYLFATWWLLTHRLDRFWLPVVPVLAVLAGMGADWTRDWFWSALLTLVTTVGIASNLVYDSTALVSLNQWTTDLESLRRDVPRMLDPALALLDEESPPGARILLVGQSGVFHVRHAIVYNTVFNLETIETLAAGRTPAQFRRELAARGVTHVYVDWGEIERYRSPKNYGFTPFVTRERFGEWVRDGILAPPRRLGSRQELYSVHSDSQG
jgi:hypothetical protein